MKIDPDDFRVRPGEKLKLKERPTRVKPYYASEEQYRKRLGEQVEQLSALQSLRNGRRLPWRSVKRPLHTRITMAPVCTAARLALVTHVPMSAKSCRKTDAKVSTATCGKQSRPMAIEMRQTSMLRSGAGPLVAAAA